MSCSNESTCCNRRGSGYIMIIVLYILLAIILGSCMTF